LETFSLDEIVITLFLSDLELSGKNKDSGGFVFWHTGKISSSGRGQQKKICDTNPLVVVVERGKNGEIFKKV